MVPDKYLVTEVLLGINILGLEEISINHREKLVKWAGLTYPLTMNDYHYGKVKSVKEHEGKNSNTAADKSFIRANSKLMIQPGKAMLLELNIEEEEGTLIITRALNAQASVFAIIYS